MDPRHLVDPTPTPTPVPALPVSSVAEPAGAPPAAEATTGLVTTESTPGRASRRLVTGSTALVAATGAAGGLGLGLAGPSAAAGARYQTRRWNGAPLLNRGARHLVGRYSYGITPALARQVFAAGGARAWFDKQLDVGSVPDTRASTLRSWWPSLNRTPAQLWQRQLDGTEGGWAVMQDLQRYQIARRMISQRQVHEVMSEFWQHHLNVPVDGDGVFTHRVSYDETVREHALGSFADLLYATTTHPAMGIYLDNAVSTATNPNENLGRELLELHTVGRGSYGEEDVKASARILTGWRVDLWRTWEPTYALADHWTGPVRVMGFTDPNQPRTAAEAKALTRRYTDYLAHHPRTAQRIALKLALKFVSDTPPPSLVDRLTAVYLRHGTQIKPVLRALVASTEFGNARGKKVKDPVEDVVSTYRALRVSLRRPSGEQAAANATVWQASDLGQRPFSWPTPDGQPLDNASWSSPSRMLASMNLHYTMSGGWWPTAGIAYRTPAQWLPQRRIRFDILVDHLCQTMLHQRSTPRLLEACCESVGIRPGAVVDAEHPVVRWSFARVLTTILDSPDHLTR